MGLKKITHSTALGSVFVLLLIISKAESARLEDLLNLNQQPREEREAQYYQNRYGSDSSVQKVSSLTIKPEETQEARERENANIGKRCIRCDYYNRDYNRNPYEYRSRYDDSRYDDRHDDRYYRDRNDDRGRDRYYDDYDKRYYDVKRYNDYDRRYENRDKYDRDRYDRRPDYYDYYYDRGNDRDKYDRDDRYRYRYDDRSYVRNDYNGYRPWDETTRGSSGFDSSGRGYYFAVGRPEYSTGYASGWNTNDDRNSSRDRWRDQGFSSSSYRPRDPYDPGYKGTSYLYGRPSSTTTTESPGTLGGGGPTDSPDSQSNTSSG